MATRRAYAEKSIVWNFMRLYSLLEQMNILFHNLMNVLLVYRTILALQDW